ncbi:MAG: amidohydrolase [Clostridiales bacterium]|nr:amidohydrolase [Clostridiales bacterium]
MNDLMKQAQELAPELVRWRRHIHENPEVSAVLPNTCAYVTEELKKMGYQPYDVGGGVVAVLEGEPGGKVIMLRGDMDALPMAEESGEPFASKNPHAAHTCGHDTHTAMLLGAAKLLMENRDKVKGTVKFMFQPGEEGYNGCKNMLAAGLLENPKVDAAFGMHSAAAGDYKTGTALYAKYIYAASADAFKVTVRGKGAHGASPEAGIDPINIIVHIHLALQTINSRERNQKEPLILTIGQIVAGDACNIIPETGFFTGTIRTFNQEVREHAKRRFVEIVNGICATFGGSAEIEWTTEMAPTVNDPAITDELLGYLTELLGEENMVEVPAAMGSEDFSEVLLNVPGTYINLSFGSKEEGYLYGAHHPKIRLNEDALPVGSAIYAQAALRWLEENR